MKIAVVALLEQNSSLASSRVFSEYFSEKHTSVVISPYALAWAYRFDISRVMESMAECYSGILINRDIDARLDQSIELMREYSADGFIFYSNRSCKADSFGFLGLKKKLSEKPDCLGSSLMVISVMTITFLKKSSSRR